MSHELAEVFGRAAMAYVGQAPWHKLGETLQPGADVETWQAAAFPWSLRTTPVAFAPMAVSGEPIGDLTAVRVDAGANAGSLFNLAKMEDRRVVYRSDNGQPLSVVSDRYKIVQPREVLEFFTDLVADQGFELETAGALKDGRIYWALARTGQIATVGSDKHMAYTLLATSCDGSMANTARLTDVRVVCWNTLSYAESGSQGSVVKSRHSREFNADEFKRNLGLVDFGKSWFDHVETLDNLSQTAVTPIQAAEFAVTVSKDAKGMEALAKAATPVTLSAVSSATVGANYQRGRLAADLADLKSEMAATMEKLQKTGGKTEADTIMSESGHGARKLMETILTGKGQDTDAARGTAYGLLQGATRWVDHERKSKDQGTRTGTAWFGDGETIKSRAKDMVLAYASAA